MLSSNGNITLNESTNMRSTRYMQMKRVKTVSKRGFSYVLFGRSNGTATHFKSYRTKYQESVAQIKALFQKCTSL